MLPTPPKCTWGLHIEVSHFLHVTVNDAISKLKHDFVSGVFVELSFFIRNSFPDDFLFVEVSSDGFKVTFFEVLYFV